jgi:hypothetical protein
MNTETQQTVIQAPPPQEPSILDQIRNDHELVARLSITSQELEALSKCALLGTLTCKEDMLFILRQIRDARRPDPEAQAPRGPGASTASTASSAPPLRAADILRKIRLLSMVKTENGASAAEADNAARLARTLMDRYSIKTVEERPVAQRPAAKLTWVYWQELARKNLFVFVEQTFWQLISATTRLARSTGQSFLISPVTPAMKMALSSHPAIICTHR